MLQRKNTTSNLFPNKMNIYLNMFHAMMKNRILSHDDNTEVVANVGA